MTKKNTADEGLVLADIIVKGMEEKKAREIVVMDLRKIKSAVTDFFVICHGDSNTQVEAIASSVEEEVEKALGETPWHKEGYENSEWILLDYINVVVHIFQADKREFYGVEELWGDADIKRY